MYADQFDQWAMINLDSAKKAGGLSDQQVTSALANRESAYNNRGYGIPLFKSDDSGNLYCSQVAWLTWKKLGVDIDGDSSNISEKTQDISLLSIPITITVGWWTIGIWVVVAIVIVIIIVWDIVFPIDIVKSRYATPVQKYAGTGFPR